MRKIFASKKQGQALVEFVIVLPLFLLLVVLIFDLGRAIYFYSAIHNAVREGARYGIVDQNVSRIEAVTREKAVGLEINPVVNITSDTVVVTVDYHFSTVTPLLDRVIGSSGLMLHSRATMYYER
jgi:Flp pilus assembly protein TadG